MKGQLESARARVQELKSNLSVQSHTHVEGSERKGLKDDSQGVYVHADTDTVREREGEGEKEGDGVRQSISESPNDVIPETFEGVLSELKGIFTSKMNQQLDANGTLQMKIKDLENRLHLKSLEVSEVRENLDSQMTEFKGALGELTAVRTFMCVCMCVCLCVYVCIYVCTYVCMYVCMYACMYVQYVCKCVRKFLLKCTLFSCFIFILTLSQRFLESVIQGPGRS